MNHRRSLTSRDETKYFDLIHVDIFITNILSRLPMKSIAQCRCVCKLWSSLIRLPYYNLLFPMIKSPTPPRILFTIENEGELFYYSLPQPHNPDEDTSLVATFHHRTHGKNFSILSYPIGGLVCRQHVRKNNSSVVVISNHITVEFLALPKLSMDVIRREWLKVHGTYMVGKTNKTYILGYDPIGKQLKVLRITASGHLPECGQYHHVLTFESGNINLLWRKIQCCTLHFPIKYLTAICISGLLYYAADHIFACFTIACFDVRSEKFSFINIDEDIVNMTYSYSLGFNLIDYKGKLGASNYNIVRNIFELWVLENAERQKWSKHIYQMPNPWLQTMTCVLRVAGIIGSGEIVFYPTKTQDELFIFYYNLESNILTRVILEVPLLFSGSCLVSAFTNYVGDVRLMN